MAEAGFWIVWGRPTQGREQTSPRPAQRDKGYLVDAWVDEGKAEATGLYEEALRKAERSP